MNMLELAKEVQKEQELHDVGGDEATLATVPGAVRVRCQSRSSGYQAVPSPRCHAGHTIAACGSTFLTCQRADILYVCPAAACCNANEGPAARRSQRADAHA